MFDCFGAAIFLRPQGNGIWSTRSFGKTLGNLRLAGFWNFILRISGSRNSSSSLIASEEIKSEEISSCFSPAHLTKSSGDFGFWFRRCKSRNTSRTMTKACHPVTTLTVDFDESLQKRISNNAKIRFSATFDLGQHVGTSVLEQDLVSYSYFTLGLNARYNHSPKFENSRTPHPSKIIRRGLFRKDLTKMLLRFQASAFTYIPKNWIFHTVWLQSYEG